MPTLKVATFEVEFLWVLSPLDDTGTSISVYVRVIIQKAPPFVGPTIRNQSVGQSVNSYAKLKMKLKERFPTQGGRKGDGRGGDAESAAQDVAAALEHAKSAAMRMPPGAPLGTSVTQLSLAMLHCVSRVGRQHAAACAQNCAGCGATCSALLAAANAIVRLSGHSSARAHHQSSTRC